MRKIKMRASMHIKCLLFPNVPVLVGAQMDGKANYIAIGLTGLLCYDTVSVSLGRGQYSNRGIAENKTFSVNQLSAGMVSHLDYCGVVSGRDEDKSLIFENFYGDLKTAPMIRECPVSLECRVIDVIKRPVHNVYIGEINDVYINEECLTNGVPDISKIDPILFAPDCDGKYSASYYHVGNKTAKAFDAYTSLDKK